MIRNQVAILTKVIFITGCISYGGNTQSEFSAIEKTKCNEKSDEFYFFKEHELIDFEYEELGLVKAQGGKQVNMTIVMHELKHNAWNNCANAIIRVSKSKTKRVSGIVFSNEKKDIYNSKVLIGQAVRVELTEEFKSKYADNKDSMKFVKWVDQRKAWEKQKTKNEVGASIIAGAVGIIVLVISK